MDFVGADDHKCINFVGFNTIGYYVHEIRSEKGIV